VNESLSCQTTRPIYMPSKAELGRRKRQSLRDSRAYHRDRDLDGERTSQTSLASIDARLARIRLTIPPSRSAVPTPYQTEASGSNEFSEESLHDPSLRMKESESQLLYGIA